jgi:S-formylglutathione hydrolase
VSPSQVPWGQQAFTAYLGENKKTWEHYDPVSLILQGAKLPEIFIDQGLVTPFMKISYALKVLKECATR